MLFAVVCVAETKPEVLSDLLVKTYKAYPEASPSLCILTSKDKSFYKSMEPSRPPWKTAFESPFRGYTAERVAETIRNDLGGETIHQQYCAVLDEQTLERESVLLVKTWRGKESNVPQDNESKIVKVRVPFSEVNTLLQCCAVGEASLEEELWNGGEQG